MLNVCIDNGEHSIMERKNNSGNQKSVNMHTNIKKKTSDRTIKFTWS